MAVGWTCAFSKTGARARPAARWVFRRNAGTRSWKIPTARCGFAVRTACTCVLAVRIDSSPSRKWPHSDGAYPALGLDSLGRLLVPTSDGLARRTARGWETVTVDDGLGSSGISAVFRDREGNIWLGLLGSGLARWLGYNEWQSWTDREGLSRSSVSSLAVRMRAARFGRARRTDWITRRFETAEAGIGSIERFRDSKRSKPLFPVRMEFCGSSVTKPNSSGLTRAPAGAADRNAEASWRRSTPHGGSRGQRVGFHHARLVPHHQGKPVRESPAARLRLLRAFRDDSRGPQRRVWAAGDLGLARYSDGQWMRYTAADGLKNSAISQVAADADGSVWIGYRDDLGITRLSFAGGRAQKSSISPPATTRCAPTNPSFSGSIAGDGCGWARITARTFSIARAGATSDGPTA